VDLEAPLAPSSQLELILLKSMTSLKTQEEFFRYDFFNNCWKDMCPLIEAVANPAVSSFNSKIFCFGGQFDLKGANNKLQIYDSIANQWSLGNRTLSPQNPVAGNGFILS